jgi:Flp pilus assembly protein protease CpaA
VAAAGFDIRAGRIPTWLTAPGVLAGLILWIPDTTPLAFAGVAGVVLATFVVGFVLFAGGVLGGGDGKLLTCMAALAGPRLFLECIGWMLILGIAVSIVFLAWKRALLPLARRLVSILGELIRFGVVTTPVVEGEPHRIPYALIAALGALAGLASNHLGHSLLP